MAQATQRIRQPLPKRSVGGESKEPAKVAPTKTPLPPPKFGLKRPPLATANASKKSVFRDTLIPDLPVQFSGHEWYAIPTIGDGSCLIHSTLQAVSSEYRDSKSDDKTEIANDIRLGMVYQINKRVELNTPYANDVLEEGILDRDTLRAAGLAYQVDDYNQPIPPYSERLPEWYQAEGGIFLNMFWQNISAIQSALNARIEDYLSPSSRDDPRNVVYGGGNSLRRRSGAPNELLIDYSLYGMTHLMNSNSYIGDELIRLVADYFEVNIVMVDCTMSPSRILHQTIRWETKEWDFIFIAYVPGHYQTIGCKVADDMMQYCFTSDHPAIAPFIPSDYDLGHGEIEWMPDMGMDRPQFVPITLEDSLNTISDNIMAIYAGGERLNFVSPDDQAYDDLMAIDDFEYINYVPHYAMFLHLRSQLATSLPSYYNLLRAKFMERGAFDIDEDGQFDASRGAEYTNYLWPSIIDAPVIRTNPDKRSIPIYESSGQFPGENILAAILYVYNFSQPVLLEQIETYGSIGQIILNIYNEMMAQGSEGEEEAGEEEEE